VEEDVATPWITPPKIRNSSKPDDSCLYMGLIFGLSKLLSNENMSNEKDSMLPIDASVAGATSQVVLK